jgi:hypothetical protein
MTPLFVLTPLLVLQYHPHRWFYGIRCPGVAMQARPEQPLRTNDEAQQGARRQELGVYHLALFLQCSLAFQRLKAAGCRR